MNTNYLLPQKCKKIGLFILLPTVLFYIIYEYLDTSLFYSGPEIFKMKVPVFFEDGKFLSITSKSVYNGVIGGIVLISSLMISFSKEKQEDEFIEKIRLNSLLWTVYVNSLLVFISLILFYDGTFFWMMVFNLFNVLWLFSIRFNWQINKLSKLSHHEE